MNAFICMPTTQSRTKHSIRKYLDWYNQERPHSNLNRLTPDEAYYGLLSPLKKAA
jgi:putative transposase